MMTKFQLILLFTSTTALSLSDGCTDDDDNNEGDDSESESETEDVLACMDQVCVNPDGNTHTDCDCAADYCVPDVDGVEGAGLTRLTCIVKDCNVDDATTCPDGRQCSAIPTIVIDLMAQQGITMPETLCTPVQ